MPGSESQHRLIDLLADAATHEVEFVRLGRLLESAGSQWERDRDLFATRLDEACDQEDRVAAERSFISACFVAEELLEQIGPRYEQAFDLAATHYELAMREQKQLDPTRVAEIRELASSFHDLPSQLLSAAERATRNSDTAGTLAVTAALYPPNRDLESALVRFEGLQRQMIGIFRSVRERYRRLLEVIDATPLG